MACASDGAASALGGQRKRALVELLAGHHLVGEADAERLLGPHLTAGEAQLLGAAGAHQAGEALRAAASGDRPEQHLGLAVHGPLAGDAVVARQRQLAATTECVAGHRGDDEPRDRGDRVERGVEALGDRTRLLGTAELGDVGACGEDPFAARHDHCAGWVGGQVVGDLLQRTEHRLRQGVHLAVVQCDDGDAVLAAFEQDEWIAHRTIMLRGRRPACCRLRSRGRSCAAPPIR